MTYRVRRDFIFAAESYRMTTQVYEEAEFKLLPDGDHRALVLGGSSLSVAVVEELTRRGIRCAMAAMTRSIGHLYPSQFSGSTIPSVRQNLFSMPVKRSMV